MRRSRRVTRGYGLLESYLAKLRARKANELIPDGNSGRILDIGCGVYPLFLLNSDFSEKYGLDKGVNINCGMLYQGNDIVLFNHDIEKEEGLPFDDNYFNVVTMLAVMEHIEQKKAMNVMKEVYRILLPSGIFILTVPAVWTKKFLEFMARLRIVSPYEIAEHKYFYPDSVIVSMLQKVKFEEEKIQFGYFEMFMNRWATAIK